MVRVGATTRFESGGGGGAQASEDPQKERMGDGRKMWDGFCFVWPGGERTSMKRFSRW